MKQITTPLTLLLRINVPVVCPPMAKVTNATLATHVSLGGGFGFVSAGYEGASGVRRELATVRAILDSRGIPHAFGLPVGVGFLGWKLEEAGAEAPAMLDAALENNVQAIWLAFGEDHRRWVDHIRQHDETSGRKTAIFIMVNTVAEALVAANDLKADVIVAQGIESGGHGSSEAPPVFTLVSAILAALPQGAPPVLAAGGIATGAQVAAFLALGAAGAVLGTRFLLTPESLLSGPQREALLNADGTNTVRTQAFDTARATTGWPKGIDGRGLHNKLVEDLDAGVDLATIQQQLAEGTKHGLPDYSVIFAGTGVGQMHTIKDAQEVVKELHDETSKRIRAMAYLIHESREF